jgi:N-acetylneuraminic acid mutarotase
MRTQIRRAACLALAIASAATLSIATARAQGPAGKWVTGKYKPVPEPGEEFTNVVVNDTLYLIGGNAAVFAPGGKREHPARVEAYNLATDTWTQKKPVPFFADHMTAATVNGKIYVFGGTGGVRQEDPDGTLDLAWEYDPAADSWKQIAKLPSKRTAGSAIAVGGKIYFIGGSTDITAPDGKTLTAGLVVGTNESYDPATNRWESHKPMPTPRNHAAIGVVRGKIYLIGGRIGANNIAGFVASNTDVVEEYDPATDTWRALNRMPTPRSGHGWATYNNRIYVVGGEGRDYHVEGVFRDVEAFDPATNEWDKLPPLPTARHGVNVAAHDNKLFVVGGHLVFAGNGGHALDAPTNEVFEFAGATAGR